jgi:hypothetical protein
MSGPLLSHHFLQQQQQVVHATSAADDDDEQRYSESSYSFGTFSDANDPQQQADSEDSSSGELLAKRSFFPSLAEIVANTRRDVEERRRSGPFFLSLFIFFSFDFFNVFFQVHSLILCCRQFSPLMTRPQASLTHCERQQQVVSI